MMEQPIEEQSKKDKQFSVFELVDPTSDNVVFIGMSEDVEFGVKRLCKYGSGCVQFLLWVKELEKKSKKPTVRVRFEGKKEEALAYKYSLMQAYAIAGIQLLNGHRKANVDVAVADKIKTEMKLRKKELEKKVKEEVLQELEARDPKRLMLMNSVSLPSEGQSLEVSTDILDLPSPPTVSHQ